MEGISQDIYNYLSNIIKLTEKDYKRLVSLYGTKATDSVIEKMINDNEKNVHKFDYYVNKIMNDMSNLSFRSILDVYMRDVGGTIRLSQEDNIKYAKEAYEIVTELNSLFERVDCKYVRQTDVIFNSVVDQIEFCLENCDDKEILNRIEELYRRYIFVRNTLVEGNIRVVVAALRSYYKDDNSFLEMIQYGNLGLMKAVEKYNPKFNTLFITYAYYWIKQSVRTVLKSEFTTSISISYRAMEENDTRLKAINVLTNELGRNPTDEEIASYMGISNEKLKEIEAAFRESVSLSSAMPNCSKGSKEIFLVDMIEDNTIDVEEEVCSKSLHSELMKVMQKYLNEQQIFILLNRYGFNGEPLTLQQIADILDLSRQAIESSEKRSLAKVRRLAGNRLKEYL